MMLFDSQDQQPPEKQNRLLVGVLVFVYLMLTAFTYSPTLVASVSSIAILRTGNFTNVPYISVTGYYANSTLGAGIFTLGSCVSPTGTWSDNGGTIIQDAAGNCFFRQGIERAIPVAMFGAKSDLITTVLDGSITSGSNQFTSGDILFTTNDIGKTIELNYGGGANPWITTISAVSGHVATLAANANNSYPGTLKPLNVTWDSTTPDAPGSGCVAGTDSLTAVGGTFTTASVASVFKVSVLLGSAGGGASVLPISTAGTGYAVGAVVTGTATGDTQQQPVLIQVTAVNGSGGITAFTITQGGLFKNGNPTGFTWSGVGMNFATTLLTSNASFGVANLKLVTKGSYTALPGPNADGINTPTTGTNNCSGATMDLEFSVPDWSYGTDDTVAVTNAETWAESMPTTMRGLTHSLSFPQGTQTLVDGIAINAAMSWASDGPVSARLVLALGQPGVSVGGSPYGLVVAAPAYPVGDDYQQSGYGPPVVSLSNMTFEGMSPSSTYDSGASTGLSTSTNCGVAANPAARKAKALPVYLNNVAFRRCPGHALTAKFWGGDFRGFHVQLDHTNNANYPFPATSNATSTITVAVADAVNIAAAMAQVPTLYIVGPGVVDGTSISSVQTTGCSTTCNVVLSIATTTSASAIQFVVYGGSNCLDMENVANPTRFYELITAQCNIGINVVGGKQYEFHGWTAFTNNIDAEISGFSSADNSEINFYGAQFTDSYIQALDIAQQNEVVNCFGCLFKSNNVANSTVTSPADTDILISYIAGSGTSGANITTLNMFGAITDTVSTDNNIFFTTDSTGLLYCNCKVVSSNGFDPDSKGSGSPVVNPTSQAPYVVDHSSLFGDIMNGFGLSFGSDLSSGSPCLFKMNSSTIKAAQCDQSAIANLLANTYKVQSATSSANQVNMVEQNSSANYNYNLPASAGINGQPQVSGGGGSASQGYGWPTGTIGAGAMQIPVCNSTTNGAHRQVTDSSSSPAFNATATGGGSTVVDIVCNGTNWVYGG